MLFILATRITRAEKFKIIHSILHFPTFCHFITLFFYISILEYPRRYSIFIDTDLYIDYTQIIMHVKVILLQYEFCSIFYRIAKIFVGTYLCTYNYFQNQTIGNMIILILRQQNLIPNHLQYIFCFTFSKPNSNLLCPQLMNLQSNQS